jgi:hypothetical protein
MLRRLSRHLLLAASSLVAAIILLPAGCTLLHGNDCSGDNNPCADDHTEQICLSGEGDHHLSARACPGGERCVDDELGFGSCVASREGEDCTRHEACADSPLCVAGKCSALTPAVVSACSAAPVIQVPTPEEGPDGVTLATSFEPGEIAVSAGLEIEGEPLNGLDAPLCSATLPGSERVVTIDVPATSSADDPGETDLVVTIEGLDPEAVAAVTIVALQTCGDPRTFVTGKCGVFSDSVELTVDATSSSPTVWSFVLQAVQPLKQSTPFTVRARLVPYKPG